MERMCVRLTLTKEEIFDGLTRAGLRRASRTRLIVQTVVLGLVAAWCLTAAVGGQSMGRRGQITSLMIALSAVGVAAAMWIIPQRQLKAIAEQTLQSGAAPLLWVFEEGVSFGDTRPTGIDFPFGSFFCDQNDRSLVWRFAGDEVIVVPRRLLREEEWQFLTEKLSAAQKH